MKNQRTMQLAAAVSAGALSLSLAAAAPLQNKSGRGGALLRPNVLFLQLTKKYKK